MRAIVVVALLCAGCAVFDRQRFDPPTRLTLGAATRHFDSPIDPKSAAALRQSTPTPPVAALTTPHDSVMGTVGFTMASRYGTYAGGEIETGVLDTPGSSTAGIYGVAGARLSLDRVYLAGEIASGWRTVRYSLDTTDVGKMVIEPRVRADMWLGPQFTLGATAGLTLGDQTVWMIGASLGIHSHDFGRTRTH
jgi:hypothetical protein